MSEALVISPQSSRRSQLRQLITTSPEFDSVVTKSAVDESVLLGAPPKCVVICRTLPEEEIKSLLARRREKSSWKETVFILVASEDSTSRNDLADHFFAGFHGVLNDPLTEEAFGEVYALAAQVSRSQTKHRLKAAAGLIVSDVFREGGDVEVHGSLWDEVKDACNKFKRITGESISLSVVKPMMENGPGGSGTYTGVSKRVRKLMQERLRRFVKVVFSVNRKGQSGED